MNQKPGANATETDPRFPSGPWVGFFVQKIPPIGKGWMELRLTFQAGSVVGEGRDKIGNFTMHGNYDLTSGRCVWQKSYTGLHDVYYVGFNEGKGIWGTWEIPVGPATATRLHGGFHIWPEGMSHPELEALRIGADIPAEEEIAVQPATTIVSV
jgi:hypothetical protein